MPIVELALGLALLATTPETGFREQAIRLVGESDFAGLQELADQHVGSGTFASDEK